MAKEFSLTEIATNKLHYKRIREDPIYRFQCELDDIRMEMESSLCQDIPERAEVHFVDAVWSKKQWDIINQLRGEVRFLSSKVIELREKASKRKRVRYK